METYYTAYTKMLDFKTYFFIKKFTAFPELANVPPILAAYGMHTEFDKACSIAGVTDAAIKQDLLQQVAAAKQTAKIIDLTTVADAGAVAAG